MKCRKQITKVTTIPTAKELTYTGQDQELVTAGTTSDGELVYSLEKKVLIHLIFRPVMQHRNTPYGIK